jgi:hypothetical protein
MYYGADKLKHKYDNFNFYASQLRICIEMAFGMMTRKWGMYRRPLLVGLDKIKFIVKVVGRLHNFCINKRIGETETGCNPVVESNVTGRERFQEMAEALAVYEAIAESLPGLSRCRDMMTEFIQSLSLTCKKLV